jgi:hypothetical protein
MIHTERIANTERHLDIAKANNQRAEDKAKELKVLNRSLFRPAVTWNKVSFDCHPMIRNQRTDHNAILFTSYRKPN